MEKLKKQIRKMFWISLILTLCLPVGVLSIIFGTINGLIFIWVPGIALAGAGFYGTPLAWVAYGDTKELMNVLKMIYEENLYTTNEIASQLGKNEKDIASKIRTIITKGYLTGYLFENNKTLVLNNKQKQTKQVKHSDKCPSCGGTMVVENDLYVCKYCGYSETKENN